MVMLTSYKPCEKLRNGESEKANDINNDKPLIDLFINPTRSEELQAIKQLVIQPMKAYLEGLNKFRTKKLREILKYASQPCFQIPGISTANMIKKCEVYGKNVDCKSLFRPVLTDIGICCGMATNLKSDLLSIEPNQSPIRITPKNGKRNGLRVVLDQHMNKAAFGSVFGDGNAFEIFVGTSTDVAQMETKGDSLATGNHHLLQISAIQILASPSIESLDPLDRDCYFPHERRLKDFEEYSINSCELECALKRIYSTLGCTAHYHSCK